MFKFLGKLVKGFVLLVGALVCLVGCIAIVGSDDSNSSSGTNSSVSTVVDKYDIQVERAYNDGFALYIEGTLVINKDCSYAQITIPCYDVDGNRVDVALDNINNLSKGDTWKFKAMCLGDGATQYNLDKAEVVVY